MKTLLVCLSLLYLLALPALAAPTVSVTPDGFKAAGPHYVATVGKDGMLATLDVDGTPLLGAPLQYARDSHLTPSLLAVGTAPNTLAGTLKSADGHSVDVLYTFTEDGVEFFAQNHLPNYTAYTLTVSPQTLGVELLQNRTLGGAEAIQYVDHGEIRALPAWPDSRLQRLRYHLVNGAQVLCWHTGWGADFNLDEMGSINGDGWSKRLVHGDEKFHLFFRIEQPGTPGRIEAQAAPPFTALSGKTSSLFYPDEPLRWTLAAHTAEMPKAPGPLVASYTVTNFWDETVAQGKAPLAFAPDAKDPAMQQATLSLAILHKIGPYRVLFSLTRRDGQGLRSDYAAPFTILSRDPALTGRLDAPGGFDTYDYAAMVGLACIRESHTMRDFFADKDPAKWNWKDLDRIMDNAAAKSKRYGLTWFFQANEKPAWADAAGYEDLAFQMVSHCKDRCHVWEVENEPNGRMSPEDYVKNIFVPFAHGAHRADPTAQVIGPACVSVPESLRFLQAIYKAGANAGLDAISTHTYVGPGEPWEFYGNPDYLAAVRKIMAAAGEHKDLWQTEQGYTWSHTGRRNQAAYVLRQFLDGYASGIPPVRQYYFYPEYHGFEAYYLVENPKSMEHGGTWEPAASALHEMRRELGNRQFAGWLPSPNPGIFLARFHGQGNDVVAAWTLDFPLALPLAKASVARVDDTFGNPLPAARTVSLSGYPVYLHLAPGHEFASAMPNWGPNLAVSGTATTNGTAKNSQAAFLNDDLWKRRDPVAGLPDLKPRTTWSSDKTTPTPANPAQVEIALPHTDMLTRILLLTPFPAVDATPRDYLLELSVDGQKWKTIAQAKNAVGWSFLHTFPPTPARHIRLTVTRINDGWHLDGRWMFMVAPDFTKYTDNQVKIVDIQAYGPLQKP